MKTIKRWIAALCLGFLGFCPQQVQAIDTSTFYSQATQDEFVYTLVCKMLGVRDNGYYLEIGAYHPITINNTFFFEKNYNWKGVSIDISNEFEATWHSIRKNSLIIQDATRVDYEAVLASFPKVVDYLSLDIDSHYEAVLQRIPFDKYTFKVITMEHDFYRFGDLYRKREREILSSLGYYLLCPDVNMGGDAFEDWWIHPSAFPEPVFVFLKSLNLNGKDYREMAQILRSIP